MTIGILIAAVFALFGTSLISMIVNDSAVITLARDYLVIQCSMLAMLGVLIVLRSTLQGMGIVSAPTYSGITELCVCAVAAIFLVPVIGFWGVTLTTPLAWILASVPLIVSYIKTMKMKSLERERSL
jgi:Na+-driven multidrug efflux pump